MNRDIEIALSLVKEMRNELDEHKMLTEFEESWLERANGILASLGIEDTEDEE